MEKVIFNWSGGKDSSLCLLKLLESDQYDICRLLTTVNQEKGRVSMHGIREELIHLQAGQIGIPLHCVMLPDQLDMEQYDRIMSESLQAFKREGVHLGAFGDIFLEDLRKYRENKLREINVEAIFPLWNKDTDRLAREFIDLGFRAIIVSADGRKLDASFVGREFDHQFLKDLPEGVDPCGENGEFHSFVFDGPIFKDPVSFEKGKLVERSYEAPGDSAYSFSNRPAQGSSWFLDLLPDN
ncbi:diphthine--ammonia ligase [Aliifodinibius salicampi]|uniref:Diphthine--ammonia ligase n=1 Tax=Fodinibius salicampi TaxID=1920655 RepID=A0ABT3PUT7_9BACT|nr:diphthine--ammonia ligase [Fodinibius salicampi]MCW9711619.1 diphthine--ammonia ligase [Fodinibius salicampi]